MAAGDVELGPTTGRPAFVGVGMCGDSVVFARLRALYLREPSSRRRLWVGAPFSERRGSVMWLRRMTGRAWTPVLVSQAQAKYCLNIERCHGGRPAAVHAVERWGQGLRKRMQGECAGSSYWRSSGMKWRPIATRCGRSHRAGFHKGIRCTAGPL